MKKYIAESFKKDFIEFNKALYFMSILFALKANGDFQFCVDYWGFNAIMKCNYYFILLIDKMFI